MKLILKNGAQINCSLNGNNFITKDDLTGINFGNANLQIITVKDGDDTQVFHDMKMTNKWDEDDGTHLVFNRRTEREMSEERIQAKLDYIAMMTEVDLDE